MKKAGLLLAAVITVACVAQVIITSETSLVEKRRACAETTFRKNIETGKVESVIMRTIDLTLVDGVEIKREPGPTFSLSYAQVTNVLPNFDALQATFNAVANSLMTNAP